MSVSIYRFGDIYPRNDTERTVAISACVVGYVIINGYLIGALSSVLAEKARRLKKLRFRLELIESELVGLRLQVHFEIFIENKFVFRKIEKCRRWSERKF